MNKLNDNEKDLIDMYYKESDDGTTGTASISEPEFEKELNKSMEIMDVFCDNDIEVPNDFFGIIEKAEEIKTKKESNREFVIFILTSLGILLSIAAITIKLGVEIFIVMQVALYFILPISLIPISIVAVKRGEAR
jgi:hypothetical protein